MCKSRVTWRQLIAALVTVAVEVAHQSPVAHALLYRSMVSRKIMLLSSDCINE